MSATDELRAELAKRGVEYEVDDGKTVRVTRWKAYGEWASFIEYDTGETRFCADMQRLTPVQAITVTLDAGTCYYSPDDVGFTWWDENDVEHCEEYSASDECCSASCDKCGYTMMVGDDGWFDGWDEITEWWEDDGSYHKGHVLKPRFKHCPNCGRKVVDE